MIRLALVLVMFASGSAIADKEFSGDKNVTWDCGKDPEVVVSSNNATITLTGACKGLTISGNSNTITAAAVDDINVNGNTNTLTIGTLGEITINGNKNTVAWTKAKSGKQPGVQNNGNGNGVTQKKPAAPKK